MPDISQDEHKHDRSLDCLIARFLESVDAGVPVDCERFIEQHPHHEAALRRYFENVAIVEGLAQLATAGTDADHNAGPDDDDSDNSRPTRSHVSPDAETSAAPDQRGAGETRIPETFGRYRILKSLGQGAMGSVFVAHDTQLDRKVALKVPRFDTVDAEQVLERFQREARSAARLRHPNICPVYDVGEIDGRHYISMAYIDGFTLRQVVRSSAVQPQLHVALTIHKIALALAEAHRHGIIHRDLKSANVMVDESGEPIVMDFGLARSVSTDEADVTREGDILGTPAYMSPEQVEGDQQRTGPATDVYGLGVILYELLTGRLPFTGPLHSILKQIICDPPPPPSEIRPDLDPLLESICLKMMAKRIEDRYQSMDDAAAALEAYVTASASGQATVPAPGKADGRASRWIAAAIPIAGILIYGIVTFFIRIGEVHVKVVIDNESIRAVRFEDQTVTFDNSGETIRLRPGPRTFVVERDGLAAEAHEVRITKDGANILYVTVIDGELALNARNGFPPDAAEDNRDPSPIVADADSERAIAEWFIQNGAWVNVHPLNDDLDEVIRLIGHPRNRTATYRGHVAGSQIRRVQDLPGVPFTILRIEVDRRLGGSLATVYEKCAELPHLAFLQLEHVGLTDGELPDISRFTSLTGIRLSMNPGITDESVPVISEWGHLQAVAVSRTGITPAGLMTLGNRLSESGCALYLQAPLPVNVVNLPANKNVENAALWFNGRTDYVFCTEVKLPATGPFCIEAQVRPDENGSDGLIFGDLFQYAAIANRDHWRLGYSNRDAIWMVSGTERTGDSQRLVHLAMVGDGEALTLFFNGRRRHRVVLDGAYGQPDAGFRIGGRGRFSENFRGTIDEVRVSDIARYSDDYEPSDRLEPDEHTNALYHFDEGRGIVAVDSSGNGNHGVIEAATWVEIDEDLRVIPNDRASTTQTDSSGGPPLGVAPFDADQATHDQEPWVAHLRVPTE